jgi:hypothetical protein
VKSDLILDDGRTQKIINTCWLEHESNAQETLAVELIWSYQSKRSWNCHALIMRVMQLNQEEGNSPTRLLQEPTIKAQTKIMTSAATHQQAHQQLFFAGEQESRRHLSGCN